jgi:hypothetical protein
MRGPGVQAWWRSRPSLQARVLLLAPVCLVVATSACGPESSDPSAARAATADPIVVDGAPTTTSVTVAAPASDGPASSVRPRRDVLLVGDSLLYEIVPTLTENLGAHGVDVHVAGAPGTGLLSGQMDWVRQITQAVETHDPDVVVIEACCNYGATPEHPEYDYRLFDGTVVAPDSFAMYELWAQAADQAVAAASARGAQVLWVITPPVQDDHELHDRIERLNRVARHLVVEHPDLAYIDWELPLTGPDGGLIDPIPLGDGRWEPLRADFIHLGPAADAIVAGVTVDAVVAALDDGRVAAPE